MKFQLTGDLFHSRPGWLRLRHYRNGLVLLSQLVLVVLNLFNATEKRVLVQLFLQHVARTTRGLAVAGNVADEIVAAVDATGLRQCSTEHASFPDDSLELLQGQQEDQVTLLRRLVAILVVDRLRRAHGAG